MDYKTNIKTEQKQSFLQTFTTRKFQTFVAVFGF